LIDRSHHLYSSGHFFILKLKPLLSFLGTLQIPVDTFSAIPGGIRMAIES
jgi:hypothetical protein